MRLARSLPLLLLMIAALAAPAAADPAKPAASTAAERQARGEAAARDFMLGKYEQALAIYLDLYLQSDGRPEYLRNIGRCQQKLKRYDPAIDSFKEYLRRAKHLSGDERQEVQGFISEMQTALANQGAAGPAPAPVASPPSPAPPAPPPSPPPANPPAQPTPPPAPETAPQGPAWAPAPQTQTFQQPAPQSPLPPQNTGSPPFDPAYPPPGPLPPAPVLVDQNANPPAHPSSKLKTVGVLTVIAAGLLAAGGTVALLEARSTYNDGKAANCPIAGSTLCGQKADSVASANHLSQGLYVGAGLVGAAGITMIILAPSPTADGRVGLTARWQF
jgi:hypothetical protein